MSELMNAETGRNNFHTLLLASASSLALLTCGSIQRAAAEDSTPTVWIELGGNFERLNTSQAPYLPPFLAAPQPDYVTVTPAGMQKQPANSFGFEGALSYRPGGTDWIISASVRYGRALNNELFLFHTPFNTDGKKQFNFLDAQGHNDESHGILDFKVGKDVGLGRSGDGVSTLNLGLRFAQFTRQSTFAASGNSNAYIQTCCGFIYYQTLRGELHSKRSFHGFGPSISWDGSAPFAGNREGGELSFDWGANAAVLFGRQKVNVLHETQATNHGITPGIPSLLPPTYDRIVPRTRARSVTVPNAGGFAGVSYRLMNFKMKLGYRADFFFGGMDGGIDTAKKENVGFYGPFASVSVGIGG